MNNNTAEYIGANNGKMVVKYNGLLWIQSPNKTDSKIQWDWVPKEN